MWRAFPIKEIPENIPQDKIFYGECIFQHEGYALIRKTYDIDTDIWDTEFEYFENFYIWEKVTTDFGKFKKPSNSFRGYVVNFQINNNYKNIIFPNIFHLFWFYRYIIDNNICFQVESDNDIIYINFKIDKSKIFE